MSHILQAHVLCGHGALQAQLWLLVVGGAHGCGVQTAQSNSERLLELLLLFPNTLGEAKPPCTVTS